ncbi:MAG: hypothetical protein AYK18_16735 [Theionarchaea archaeon DG-70]|nr:MAG: hypothetical protein AYK18_16735 [Theionarchaea archaeon DG-70]
MRDLEQLLRYEIPGFLIIVYFLTLSKNILQESGICYQQVIKLLPALVAAAAVLALPLGYLAFSLYFSCEERVFLGKRAGIRRGGIVEQILRNYPAPDENNWWLQHENPTVRNEVLDIIFYSSIDKSEAVHVLERFITFYHSGRVIGMYVPIFSIILHLFLASYAGIDFEYILSRFIVVVILYGVYYCIIIKGKIPEDRLCGIITALHIVVILFILLIYLNNPICLFSLLLVVVWLITIPRTLEGGMLKRRIDELETNILLSKQREIVGAIGERLNLARTSTAINCL